MSYLINNQRPAHQAILFLGLLCLIVAFSSGLWGFAYGTNDDVLLESMLHGVAFEEIKKFAFLQGRYTYFLHLPVSFFPYLFEPGGFVFSLVKVASLLFFLGSLAWALNYFCYSRMFVLIFLGSCLLFWMDSWEHSLLSSYPALFFLVFSMSVIAFVFFDKYLKEGGRGFLAASLFIWFFFAIEYTLQFAFLPLFLVWQNRDKATAKPAFFGFCAVLVLYLAMYFAFRSVVGTDYKGNQFSISPLASLKTFWQLSISGFPGYGFFSPETYSYKGFPKAEPLLLAKLVFVFLAFLLLGKEVTVKSDRLHLPRLFLLVFAAVFAPNTLLSISKKYQTWVLENNVESYLSSHLSFIAWVFLFSLVFFYLISRCRTQLSFWLLKTCWLFVAIAIIVSAESHNQHHRVEQKQNFARWQLFDQFVATDFFAAIPENTHFYSRSFIKYRDDLLIANNGGYWTVRQYQASDKRQLFFSEYWWLKKQGLDDIQRLYHISYGNVDESEEMYLQAAEITPRFKNKNFSSKRIDIFLPEELSGKLVSVFLDDESGRKLLAKTSANSHLVVESSTLLDLNKISVVAN